MEPQKTNKQRAINYGTIVFVALLAFSGGFLVKSVLQSDSGTKAEAGQKWTCSMHPEVIRDGPGECPKCGMDLIPQSSMSGTLLGPHHLEISEAAAKLMELATSPVRRKFPTAQIRMVGKIDYDETRIKKITSWVKGRIDRLFVDYTGITVRQGDHLAELYSPELISAQAELLQALKAVANQNDQSSEFVKRTTRATLDAAREKLKLLGLKAEQIQEIENSGKPVTHITIYTPLGGTVIEKLASEGMYVETGTPIYTVADLSQLWLKLDAYESDLPWIKYGQEVEFTTEAYPGDVFQGAISFIDPILNAKTRTVKLRVNVKNENGKLKPDMFVRALVRSTVAQGGRVMAPSMADKWICPMHPDVVKADKGICDICEMLLVTTESLGYVDASEFGEVPLLIPTSAALITGKRAIAYVKHQGKKEPIYEGREIVLGPRAGAYYLVKSGLQEGELVVTYGNFKIDSEMQIQAKTSMMSPEGGQAPMIHQGQGASPGQHADHVSEPKKEEPILQTTCPVMGGPINKEHFVMYQGKKVYFCCPGCDKVFQENPENYLPKLPQFPQEKDQEN